MSKIWKTVHWLIRGDKVEFGKMEHSMLDMFCFL